jgi:hydroxypyruvate reductase/glycerate 2-kinase
MTRRAEPLHEDALTIWQTAVDAVRPADLIRIALDDTRLGLRSKLAMASHIIVVGAGKAGAAMSAAIEEAVPDLLDRVDGLVNVPAESVRPLQRIRLHAARPAGTNQPTAEGVAGALQILELLHQAEPDDMALCLLSGGGSALLPAPAPGLTLADKQQSTALLHACGATINEMNTVRKHLSASKGGRLAQAFAGRQLVSLIISDVIGDPIDVIASGPTAADPTTFADALAVLQKFNLEKRVPAAVLRHLQEGLAGQEPETMKVLPETVSNLVIGNNSRALSAAQSQAEKLGYGVLNLGSYVEGETRQIGVAIAGIVRSIRAESKPIAPPACVLFGGETTVTLAANHGLGGRNQECVLATTVKLGQAGLHNVCVLSGGTDGEDGPTDAAGAWADEATWAAAGQLGLAPADFLNSNDAYHFFAKTGNLMKTGLTETNVMDVRVILVR